jgi:hypothetical protein
MPYTESQILALLEARLASEPGVEIDRAPVNASGGFTAVHRVSNAGFFIAGGMVRVAMQYDEARSLVQREWPDGSVVLRLRRLRAFKGECVDGDVLLYYSTPVVCFDAASVRVCVALVRALFARAT